MSVYTINANTLGISEYTGWIPVELVSHNNTLLVLQTGGLSEHTGTTDDGVDIDCFITTGKLMAGDRNAKKEIHHLWLTLAGDDAVEVTLYPSFWDGQNTIGPYNVPALSTDEPHNRVLRGLLGEAGQWWQIKVANKDGGKFDLRSLVLVLDQTQILM